ncbi:MAG: glutaredoxin family protein [Gammaproteobacteria bacterium]
MIGCKKPLQGHQLFYFATCPFCIKVRMALWKMRIRIPLRNIHRHAKYKKELEEGGGKLQVPCLRVEEHGDKVHWLYESDDIIQYLHKIKSMS